MEQRDRVISEIVQTRESIEEEFRKILGVYQIEIFDCSFGMAVVCNTLAL